MLFERHRLSLALAVELKRAHRSGCRAFQANHSDRIDVAIAQGVCAHFLGERV
jgi:hypothetical protein